MLLLVIILPLLGFIGTWVLSKIQFIQKKAPSVLKIFPTTLLFINVLISIYIFYTISYLQGLKNSQHLADLGKHIKAIGLDNLNADLFKKHVEPSNPFVDVARICQEQLSLSLGIPNTGSFRDFFYPTKEAPECDASRLARFLADEISLP